MTMLLAPPRFKYAEIARNLNDVWFFLEEESWERKFGARDNGLPAG